MPFLRSVKDINMASANVQAGSSAPGVGGQFLNGPYLNPIEYSVLDSTAAAPAVLGKAVVLDTANAAPGAYYKQSAVANQAVGAGKVGIVTVPATSTTANQATIVVQGVCTALATTTANTNKAIAVGDPLCLDGAGNLTSAPATPAAGTVVATALAAMAGGTGVATKLLVDMGGY